MPTDRTSTESGWCEVFRICYSWNKPRWRMALPPIKDFLMPTMSLSPRLFSQRSDQRSDPTKKWIKRKNEWRNIETNFVLSLDSQPSSCCSKSYFQKLVINIKNIKFHISTALEWRPYVFARIKSFILSNTNHIYTIKQWRKGTNTYRKSILNILSEIYTIHIIGNNNTKAKIDT